MMKSLRAFTLIELLVVISIIALLLAILMPALNIAREHAKSAVGLVNTKQWVTMMLMYTDDYEGKFWYDGPDFTRPDGQLQGFWMPVLSPYTSDINDYRLCPSAEKLDYDAVDVANDFKHGSTFEAWDTGSHSAFSPDEKQNYGSYGINLWLSPTFDSSRPGWGWKADLHWGAIQSSKASNIPMIGDCAWFGMEPPDMASRQPGHQVPPERDWYKRHKPQSGGGTWRDYMARACMDRHNGGVNWAFMDGSARKVLLPDLWTLDWHRNYHKEFDVIIPWL